MALLLGSTATDRGVDATCSGAPISSWDQRDNQRPFGAHCDSGALEQSPSISLLPRNGYHSQAVTVAGMSFTPSKTVTLYWNCAASPCSTPLDTVLVSGPGAFTQAITIPATALVGSRHVLAVDTNPIRRQAFASLIVRRLITLPPAAGYHGEAITVHGYSFSPREMVSVYWNCGSLSACSARTPIAHAMSGRNGDWAATVTVPAATSPGTNSVGAAGSTRSIATVPIVVKTSLTLLSSH